MKLPTRKPKPTVKRSAFADLVAEAVEMKKEYEALSPLAAQKGTAQAYQNEAWRIAGNPPVEHRQKVREAIEHPTSFEGSEFAGAFRRAIAAIRTPNWPWPPRELRRLNFLLTPGAVAELAALGSNSFELFAIAAEVCAERYPDAFGTCEDRDAYEQRMLDLRTRLDELFKRIGEDWRPEDIQTSTPDQQRRVLQTFALSKGDVSVHPVESAGERLVNWMLANERSATKG